VCATLEREWSATPEEKRGPRACEREARRQVAELAPGDGRARFAWALLLDETEVRVEELREAVRLAPTDPRPRHALGEDLIELGRVEEGARRLVEAAERYRPDDLAEHGPDIVHLLRANGREEEERRVREAMEGAGP
jgi:hypothetical protein